MSFKAFSSILLVVPSCYGQISTGKTNPSLLELCYTHAGNTVWLIQRNL